MLLLAQLLHWLAANKLLQRADRNTTPADSALPLLLSLTAVFAFSLLLLLLLNYCSCFFVPRVSSSQSNGCSTAHTRGTHTRSRHGAGASQHRGSVHIT
jgi:hypothetical protein